MLTAECHAEPRTSPGVDAARHLLMKVLGPRRVAGWCNCTESAIYQWLSRGTEDEPIPTSRVLPIMVGASNEGLDAPIAVLWPAMARQLEKADAAERSKAAPEDVQ